MGKNLITRMTSAVLFAGFGLMGQQAMAKSITDFNVLITGTATLTNTHVDGKTAIGGNLVSNGSNYAQQLSTTTYASTKTLVVGGNVSGTSLDLHAGVFSYGSLNSGTTIQPNSITKVQSSFDVADYAAQMQQWSTAFKAMTANSTLNTSGNPTFVATPANTGGLAVFNVSSSIFSNSAYQNGFNFSFGNAGSIVINVTGTSVNFSTGNFNSTSFANDIIWNFADATSIDLSNIGGTFQGTILAPKATVTINNRQINGSIYAANLIASGAEFHKYDYQGYEPSTSTPSVEPTPVPLPTPVLLGGLGLLCMFGHRAWSSRRKSEL